MDNNKLQAYPVANPTSEYTSGLTKLEVFTMAAMQGLCNSAGSEWINGRSLTQSQVDLISRSAVWIATATLSELYKQKL